MDTDQKIVRGGVVVLIVFLAGWCGVLVSSVVRSAKAQERSAAAEERNAAAEERKAQAEEGLTAAHQVVALGSLHASWQSAPVVFTVDTPKDPKLPAKVQGERFRQEIAAYLEVFPYKRQE